MNSTLYLRLLVPDRDLQRSVLPVLRSGFIRQIEIFADKDAGGLNKHVLYHKCISGYRKKLQIDYQNLDTGNGIMQMQ